MSLHILSIHIQLNLRLRLPLLPHTFASLEPSSSTAQESWPLHGQPTKIARFKCHDSLLMVWFQHCPVPVQLEPMEYAWVHCSAFHTLPWASDIIFALIHVSEVTSHLPISESCSPISRNSPWPRLLGCSLKISSYIVEIFYSKVPCWQAAALFSDWHELVVA